MRSYIELTTRKGRNLFYQSPEWRGIRTIILRDNPYCQECLRNGIYELSREVDHIIDIKISPEKCLSYDNLQALCKSCHSKKTFRENTKKNFTQKNVFTVVNKKWKNLGIK